MVWSPHYIYTHTHTIYTSSNVDRRIIRSFRLSSFGLLLCVRYVCVCFIYTYYIVYYIAVELAFVQCACIIHNIKTYCCQLAICQTIKLNAICLRQTTCLIRKYALEKNCERCKWNYRYYMVCFFVASFYHLLTLFDMCVCVCVMDHDLAGRV